MRSFGEPTEHPGMTIYCGNDECGVAAPYPASWMAPSARQKTPEHQLQLSINLIALDTSTNPGRLTGDSIKALVDSIERDGLIEPIVVRPINANSYEIVSGARRLAAYKLLARRNPGKYGLIPVSLTNSAREIDKKLVNLARADYNPMQTAEALAEIRDRHKLNHAQLADLVNKTRPAISGSLSLLSLPPEIRKKACLNKDVTYNFLKKLTKLQESEALQAYADFEQGQVKSPGWRNETERQRLLTDRHLKLINRFNSALGKMAKISDPQCKAEILERLAEVAAQIGRVCTTLASADSLEKR